MVNLKSLIGAAALACMASLAQAQVIGIATNPQGSFYYSVGTAVAKVAQQKANMTARVQAMSGSSAYTPLVNRGEVEFGLMNSMDVINAYTGVDNFKDHKNADIRLVGVLFPIRVGIAVANDSPAKSVADLKGMRMPSQFTSQNTIAMTQDAMLATGGLSIADMKQFPVANYVKGMQALGEDKVDAAQFCLGCGTAQEANVALASRGGLRFLPLLDTPEAKAAMHKVFSSAYTQVFQPSPAYPGVSVPIRLMAFSAFLFTSTHVSDDVVYRLTKALYENKADLAATTAVMKAFDPGTMAEATSVPYHPGAEKFYKEIGQWPPKPR